MMRHFLTSAAALALFACSPQPADDAAAPSAAEPAAVDAASAETPPAAETEIVAVSAGEHLAAVLAAQPDDAKARYQWRHPEETLQFFGIEPGMTVVEALPGEGWYSKILIPYLGEGGKLIGANYALDMWPLFGGFATPEFVETQRTWTTDWPAQAAGWGEGAEVAAFDFGSMPAEFEGTADAVLFIRALHNMSRFEADGGYLTKGIADAYAVLKPGGVVGVVQHRAPEGNSDEWANGSAGYLKQAAVIAAFEAAGFEFIDSSEVNANPNDQPTEEDIVWRLPPSYGTSDGNEELKAQMEAIGESDRMTLKFRKPA